MLSQAKACTRNFEKKKTVTMCYQLRGLYVPKHIFHSIELKRKEKTRTTSNLREGFYEARELEVMSILSGIHE